MKSLRAASYVSLLATLLLAACSRDRLTAPGPHAIAGRVRLVGNFVDANARYIGTHDVNDADGVPVELVRGDRVVAQTRTAGGGYRFPAVNPGSYLVRVRVIGSIAYDTKPLTVANFDIAAAETLRVLSKGDLYPVPNPIGPSTSIFFYVPDSEQVVVSIVDLSGNRIRQLIAGGIPAGLNQVTWDGLDQDGHAPATPLNWVTFASGDSVRAQLLFK